MLTRVLEQAACGLFFFVVWASVASAASIGVSPVRVTLSDSQKIGTLTVRNDGTEPVSMQMEVLNWSQRGGRRMFSQPPASCLPTRPFLPCQLVARSWSGLGCGARLMRSAS